MIESIYTDNNGYFYGIAIKKHSGTNIPRHNSHITIFAIRYDP